MGANPTQALAFSIFLLAFTVIAGGMAAGGSVVLLLAGFGLLAASAALFLKAKPWEHRES